MNIDYYNFNEKDLIEYVSKLEILDLTEERILGITTGKGFIIDVSTSFKSKHIISKDLDTIASNKFGSTQLDGESNGIQPYRCKCGMRTGMINNNSVCPICHSVVEFTGEDFEYFGWIVLKNCRYIHPQMYILLKSLIGGPTLDDIIEPISDAIDSDGKTNLDNTKKKIKSIYSGIGIIKFEEKFDEILDYFLNKKKDKKEVYTFLKENKQKIFTDSYPVYTIQLRPIKQSNGQCEYNDMNEFFADLSKVAAYLNNETATFKNEYLKDKTLFKFQSIVNDIYQYVSGNILPKKYGSIKKCIGGRCNLTSRNVIIPNDNIGVDECIISYYSAVKVMEQFIINILYRTLHNDMNSARIRWEKACSVKDELVERIIFDLIHEHKSGRGFPIIVNRNPTIKFGGVMALYVVGITDSYSLEIPLLLCDTMAADFDGDKFNTMWSLLDEFEIASQDIFNPRNNLFISKNNGLFNRDMSQTADIMLNMNSLHSMYFNYTSDEIAMNESIVQNNRI